MKSIKFNREELYKELWSKPMTQIAEEHNINVNQKPLNEEFLVILERTNFSEADSNC